MMQEVIKTLKSLDDAQVKELFIDIADIRVVERIADIAYKVFAQHVLDVSKNFMHELSDEDDALQVDIARRMREL